MLPSEPASTGQSVAESLPFAPTSSALRAGEAVPVALPLHLVAVATGENVESRAFLSGTACGEAVGYSVGDSPLLGAQLVSIQPGEVVLETSGGLRRLPMSTEKCKLPVLRATAAGAPDEASRAKVVAEKQAFNAEMEQRIAEGEKRRAEMTPAEIEKYEKQNNPECWPDEVPAGKTELDVIPEYCY